MKVFVIALAAASLVACNITDKEATVKGSETVAPVKDSTKFTTIEWIDSTTQDLGKLKAGQVVELSWKFRNTGSYPLVIEDVQPTCGCTVADKPTEPIAPGGEGLIRAKYNSQGNNGHVSKHMTVLANLKNHNSGNVSQLGFTAEVSE